MRTSIPAILLVALAATTGCTHFVDSIRRRGSADLDCPVSRIEARATGLGGWYVEGCDRSARYVCTRRVCVMEGTPEPAPGAAALAAPAERSLGEWSCQYFGGDAIDQARAHGALRTREARLSACPTRTFALSLGGSPTAAVLRADGDRACVEGALAALELTVGHEISTTCTRP